MARDRTSSQPSGSSRSAGLVSRDELELLRSRRTLGGGPHLFDLVLGRAQTAQLVAERIELPPPGVALTIEGAELLRGADHQREDDPSEGEPCRVAVRQRLVGIEPGPGQHPATRAAATAGIGPPASPAPVTTSATSTASGRAGSSNDPAARMTPTAPPIASTHASTMAERRAGLVLGPGGGGHRSGIVGLPRRPRLGRPAAGSILPMTWAARA